MFYSQFGEDKILAKLFAQKAIGVCVEVGANNGVWGSTTLHFEEQGWECLLIEPNPSLCRELRVKRRARVVEAAASDQTGTATLQIASGADLAHGVSALGGAAEAQRISRRHGFKTHPVEVMVRRLDDILEESNFERSIDFISIDVEGHELQVLEGFTANLWRPTVIIVEDNTLFGSAAVNRKLGAQGYVRFLRTGVNDWYAHRENSRLGGLASRLGYYPSMLGARTTMARNEILGKLGRVRLLTPLRDLVRKKPRPS